MYRNIKGLSEDGEKCLGKSYLKPTMASSSIKRRNLLPQISLDKRIITSPQSDTHRGMTAARSGVFGGLK